MRNPAEARIVKSKSENENLNYRPAYRIFPGTNFFTFLIDEILDNFRENIL